MHEEPTRPTLLRALGRTCKTARMAAGKRLPALVAELHRDQSTLYRFEQGVAWPRDVEDVVEAYARIAGMGAGVRLWQAALDAWRADIGATPSTAAGVAERWAAADAVRGDSEALEQRLTAAMDARDRRLMDALLALERNTERLAQRLDAPAPGAGRRGRQRPA